MKNHQINGETFVLCGKEPGYFLSESLIEGSVRLRSCFRQKDPHNIDYEEGRDYMVDYSSGLLFRTENSRIPDYAEYPYRDQFLKKCFDLDSVPECNISSIFNIPFFVYADSIGAGYPVDVQNGSPKLKIPANKEKLKVLFYGDSITYGKDATVVERSYAWLFSRKLENAFPNTLVESCNPSICGLSSRTAKKNFDAILQKETPDILLLAFGMNDQSCSRGVSGIPAVSKSEFHDNISAMAASAVEKFACRIVLITPILPNPGWLAVSGGIEDFRNIILELAMKNNYSFADGTGIWRRMLKRKKFEDLLANNLNHPNDFGHSLIADALSKNVL